VTVIQRKFKYFIMQKRLGGSRKEQNTEMLKKLEYMPKGRANSLFKITIDNSKLLPQTNLRNRNHSINKKTNMLYASKARQTNERKAMLRNIISAAKSNTIKYLEKKAKSLTTEDINIKDNDGNTPLHFACLKGHTDMAKTLLKLGARINDRNKDGNTPLHLAFKGDNHRVISTLIIS